MNFKGLKRTNFKIKEKTLHFVDNNKYHVDYCEQIEQQTLIIPSAPNEKIIIYKSNDHLFFSAKNNTPKLIPTLIPAKINKKLTTLPIIPPQKKIPLHSVIAKPINENRRNKIISMQKCLRKKKVKKARAYKREQFNAYKEQLKKHRYYLYYLEPLQIKIKSQNNISEKKANPYHFFVSAQNAIQQQHLDILVHRT